MTDHTIRTVEPGTTDWDIAWARLRDSGRDFTQWMLMHAEDTGIQCTYLFKNIHTRQYVRVLRFA